MTSAMCEYYSKSDDCYELNQLRDFRDSWLYNQEGGKLLIERYYKGAPVLLDKIYEDSQKSKTMENIKDYILKCVTLIEDKKYEDTKKLYIEMLNSLSEKYNVNI